MLKADKDEELLAVLDENGNFTGNYEARGIVHEKRMFHNEIALWIIDKDNKKVLVQRRSKFKKQNPNKIALCAGHVVGKETIFEALEKEAKEEIGVDIKKYKVKQLLTIKRKEPSNYYFSHHYYIDEMIPLEQMTIQEEELSEIFYMDYETLKNLIKDNSEEVAIKWDSDYAKLFGELDKVILD